MSRLYKAARQHRAPKVRFRPILLKNSRAKFWAARRSKICQRQRTRETGYQKDNGVFQQNRPVKQPYVESNISANTQLIAKRQQLGEFDTLSPRSGGISVFWGAQRIASITLVSASRVKGG